MWRSIRSLSVKPAGISTPNSFAAVQVAHPKLAAKQFIKEDASKAKARVLRRKEVRLKKQIVRDVNNYKKHVVRNVEFSVDPVLGDVECAFLRRVRAECENADVHMALGFDRLDFEKLTYGAELAALELQRGHASLRLTIVESEERKKRALATILSLRNSNKATRRSLAIDLARREFRRHEGDTALPEVQAAVLTIKIQLGMEHVRNNQKDKTYIQTVREIVQQRQSILKYLKRDNAEAYYHTIAKLGLADDVVTREFSMGREYFEKYKVWGDKTLVHLSEKQKRKQDAFTDLLKRVKGYHDLAKANLAKINEMSEAQ